MRTVLRVAITGSMLLAALTSRSLRSEQSESTTTRARYAAILAEHTAAMKRFQAAADKAKTEKEFAALVATSYPDDTDYSRRFIELAASDPTDSAARDALLWVLARRTKRLDDSARFAEQVRRAVDLVIRHHSNELSVARLAFLLSPSQTANFGVFCAALYDRSKTHEVKGTACLALARHLDGKGQLVKRLRREKQPFRVLVEETDESGKRTTKLSEPLFDAAYETRLRALDPDALDREAESLFERVIAEYADVSYDYYTFGTKVEDSSTRKKQTLGQMAKAILGEKRNLAIGKPAPEIDEPGLDGKPMKLSDYRGKVVVLVFWGSWCVPCMREVPRERELAERYKARSFTILGVDCEAKKDDGLAGWVARR